MGLAATGGSLAGPAGAVVGGVLGLASSASNLQDAFSGLIQATKDLEAASTRTAETRNSANTILT
ncbi:hypothetical protein LAJ59_19410, partial [Streptococcus pneumoniae]|nr:hypothetical protein [Streptococcus pneumoniae]